MSYQPITSFRRAIDVAQVQRQMSRALPLHAVDKWDALRELAVARVNFGLSDRDLAVLQALLSFHPGTKLDDPAKLVVFPSNATLSERLNGMPCSTLRRHLARLVEAGAIARRDSPNGKRYRRRQGQAFGFDLTPLACRFDEIIVAADAIRNEKYLIRTLREQVILLRRDLIALSQRTGSQDMMDLANLSARMLRQNLQVAQLESLRDLLTSAVENLSANALKAENLIATGTQNERHQHSKNTYIPESEQCDENEDLHLYEVLDACDQIQSFAAEPIRDWLMLVRINEAVRPMMGICAKAWRHAQESMGKAASAVALAAMLQRFDKIGTPSAYLRGLSSKALRQEFSPKAMIKALSSASSQL